MEMPNQEAPSIPASNKVVVSGAEEGQRREKLILTEVKKQLKLAGPLLIANPLQYILPVISLMFIGHLGELALSGASMATSFTNVTGFTLLIIEYKVIFYRVCIISASLAFPLILYRLSAARRMGTANALDTLCGQSFGAQKYYFLGIHMQRAMLVITIISILVVVIWNYTDKFLILCGQDSEIAAAAGLYARWMIPALFPYGYLQCHIKFLQTQNIVLPIMLSSGITALFHILLCWSLVYKSGLGSKGAALSHAFSYWLNVLLLALYIKLSPACKRTWVGFSTEALHDIFHFIKLAIPSAAMNCLEYWAYEFLVLLSGRLPNPKLETAVLSISLNTATISYMIPFGFAVAVSTRVSNELGARNPKAVHLAIKVATFLVITEGLFMGLTMFLVRRIWGHAFSNEENVVRHVAKMMPILAATSLLDGIQCVLSGVVRGCGRQKIGTFVNLGAFYVIGIPMAVLLAFVLHIKGKGLWLGMTCGYFTQIALLAILIMCNNWEKEASKANNRVLSSMHQTPDMSNTLDDQKMDKSSTTIGC